MNRNLQTAFNKLQRKKTELSKDRKVALGLVDELDYDLMSLQDEVGRLSYSTEEWYDENFEKFLEARSGLREVYINNSESFLDPVDVEEDKRRLEEIKQKAEELGVDYTDVYPDWDEHMQQIEDLDYFTDRFVEQTNELKSFGF